MTYNTRKKVLWIGVREKVKLTKKEHRLLISLANNQITTYREIMKYLDIERPSLPRIKNNLERKTKFELRIQVVRGRGYILENEIYFE